MYATADDMIARFGKREARSLSDRELTGEPDVTVLEGGIATAASEIDTYLAGRYVLPLDPVPLVLVGVCCDIARYRLAGAEVLTSEEIRNRYKDAVAFLTRVAEGKVTLGELPSGGAVEPDDTIQFATGTRVFGRDVR